MRVFDFKFNHFRRVCSVAACLVFLGGLALGQGTDPATGQRNGFSTGQRPYWEMMQDDIVDYKATVAAFNAYWAGRTPGKGQGYTVFQRWAYLNGLRVKPDGTLPRAGAEAAEMERWDREYAQLRRTDLSPKGNWTGMGPVALPTNNTGQPNGIARTTTIAFHPTDPNRLYVGTPNGGLWASADGGATWATQTDFLPTLGVSAILVDPVTPTTMYIGTGDKDARNASGLGVYKSVDGGATWAPSNTGMGNRTVYGMRFDPNSSGTIIAATDFGIYRSTNSGASWIQTLPSGTTYQVTYRPGSTNTLYAANATRFFTSTDDGATWNAGVTVSSSGRAAFAVTRVNPNLVYMVKDVGVNPVFRSTDGGLSFSRIQTDNKLLLNGDCLGGGTGGQGWYDICISVDPANPNNIMVGGVSLWKSTDGGVNFSIAGCWSDMATNVHADHHFLAYSPLNPSRLYDCNDGGVYYTDDFGTAYTNLSSGIAASQIYRVGLSGSDPGMLVAGFQDNGTVISRQPAWITTEGGDGMDCAIDPTDNQYQYGSYVNGLIYRSTDAGFGWRTIAETGKAGGIDEEGPWLTPYALQPGNPNVMVAGYISLWRSPDVKATTPTFTKVQPFATTDPPITIVDVHFANANTVYASRSNGEFWRSTDAGVAWSQRVNTPGGGAKDIAADPVNPNNVWVASGNDIYRSTDGGGTWTLWDTGLPNIPALTVVYDRVANALYCGMWTGVYYRHATDPSWVEYKDGLPNTQAFHLQIFYDQNPVGCVGRDKLRLATYGRGVWQSDLRSNPAMAPVACFGADKTTVCVAPEVLQLRDSSAYNPTAWNWTITGPGTATFVGGTGPTTQNPQVTFSASGLYTVTLVATNANGSNTRTRNNYINVVTTPCATPCGASCPANITRNTDPNLCTALVNYTAPTGTGNCTGAAITQTAGLASGSNFPVGTTTNTFTVTSNGQTASCSFTVTVTDAQAPAITCPANITQGVGAGITSAVVTYTPPVGTDNCAASATTSQTAGLASGASFPLGTTTNTFTVTSNGQTTACSFTVTVVSNQAPAITCPANINVVSDAGSCSAVVAYTAATCTGNCAGAAITQTAGLASGSAFPVGTTTNTFTVTANGQTASCSFTVAVTDAQAPAITCPANITQGVGAGVTSAVVAYTPPVGTDNCAASATTSQTAGLASGASFPLGTTTNTFTVTSNGQTAACSFTVTVTNAQAPAITCPPNITRNTDANLCSAVVSYPAPTCTGNCTGAAITQTAGLASGSAFPAGTTTNTFTVTANGQTATCSFTVTVSAAPLVATVTSPTDACGFNVTSCCLSASAANVTNCGRNGQATASASGGCPPYAYLWNTGARTATIVGLRPGLYRVTVTDGSGNASVQSITLTQGRLLSAAVSATGGTGCLGTVTAVPSGGCGPYTYTWSGNLPGVQTVAGLGAGQYQVTVTDGYGCSATAAGQVSGSSSLVADAGVNRVVFPAYGPRSCTVLNGTATGGTPSYSGVWRLGNGAPVGTGMSVKVCPMVRTVYHLWVTDANGCTSRDSVAVCPTNISCGANKVYVCHVAPVSLARSTQCVDVSTVPTHLSHGDRLGSCSLRPGCALPGVNAAGGGGLSRNGEPEGSGREDLQPLRVRTYPNPTSGLLDVELSCGDCPVDATYVLKVSDLTGRVLLTTEVRIEGGEGSVRLNLGGYSAGVYLIRVNDLVHRVMRQ